MKADNCRTVGELIAALSKYDPAAKVDATWEGVFREIAVYQHANGTVLIDADDCFYQKGFQTDGRVERTSKTDEDDEP